MLPFTAGIRMGLGLRGGTGVLGGEWAGEGAGVGGAVVFADTSSMEAQGDLLEERSTRSDGRFFGGWKGEWRERGPGACMCPRSTHKYYRL